MKTSYCNYVILNFGHAS